ncbi:MAG TPA: hypothetical protein VMT42_04435 [candidate division Zixibacteria bacterium]|nr:hypothetical protein [candidate division Zixibacteria bacterium]
MKGEEADLFWMTLICVGGHGFRTCVEIVFMAVEAGVVNEGERVISIAGTGMGADSAMVMKGSRFEDAVGEHPEKRLKIEEILAMPKETEWSGYEPNKRRHQPLQEIRALPSSHGQTTFNSQFSDGTWDAGCIVFSRS